MIFSKNRKPSGAACECNNGSSNSLNDRVTMFNANMASSSHKDRSDKNCRILKSVPNEQRKPITTGYVENFSFSDFILCRSHSTLCLDNGRSWTGGNSGPTSAKRIRETRSHKSNAISDPFAPTYSEFVLRI